MLERLRGIVRPGWLGRDDLNAGAQCFRGDRGSAQHAAAANRTEKKIEIGHVLQQFDGDRSLPRHDIFIFEWVNQGRARFRDHARASFFARPLIRLAENDPAAVALDGAHFHLRRVRRHHDVGRDPAKLRRARESSRMVAGRMGRHPAPRGFVIEREDRVRRSTRLERADLLEVLALEKERRPTRGIETLTRQNRRAMDVRTDAIVRDADGGEVEGHGQTSGRVSFPKRLPTVMRCETGSSVAMNSRNRRENTGPRSVK